MNHLKYFVVLILCVIAGCQCDKKQINKNFIRSRRSSFLSLKERLINSLSHLKKYDMTGWLNVEKLTPDSFQTIDLTLHNGNVICTSSNKVVPVRALDHRIIFQDDNYIYSEYYFQYLGVKTKSSMKNPLPVMISKNPKVKFWENHKILPEGFEGYLICEAKGEPVSLIQHEKKQLEFISPPWRSLVDIQLYKNPLAPFGRQYKIIILDNVKVLKNGEKSFFWPLPVDSMADVYEFQKAIDDSRKGKYCTLSRDSTTFNIHLSCNSWKLSVANALVNGGFFLGLILINSCFGANFYFKKHKPLFIRKIRLVDGVVTFLYDKNNVIPPPPNSSKNKKNPQSKYPDENQVGTSSVFKKKGKIRKEESNANDKEDIPKGYEKYYPYKDDDKKRTKSIFSYGNLMYFVGWSLVNVIWGTVSLVKINSVLKRADNELKKAKLAYPWKLKYPPSKYLKVKQ